MRADVIAQYALSLRTIWMVVTPLAGMAWICTFFFKVYSLDRNQHAPAAADKEKALEDGNSDRTHVDSAEAEAEAQKPDEEAGIPKTDLGQGDNAPKSGINGKPVNRKEAAGEALEESAPY